MKLRHKRMARAAWRTVWIMVDTPYGHGAHKSGRINHWHRQFRSVR